MPTKSFFGPTPVEAERKASEWEALNPNLEIMKKETIPKLGILTGYKKIDHSAAWEVEVWYKKRSD